MKKKKLVHAYRAICALILWNKNRISMAENDISPSLLLSLPSVVIHPYASRVVVKHGTHTMVYFMVYFVVYHKKFYRPDWRLRLHEVLDTNLYLSDWAQYGSIYTRPVWVQSVDYGLLCLRMMVCFLR